MIVVVIVVAILYMRRDSIARDIANSVLADSDLIVTDLSVDSLSPERLELDELVVESSGGARYQLFGLSLPLGAPGTGPDRITAEQLIVTFDPEVPERTHLSSGLQSALELPLGRPNIEATISRVTVQNLPELIEVAWTTSRDSQNLTFDLDTIGVTVDARILDEREYALTISAVHPGGESALAAELILRQPANNIVGSGEMMLETSAWLAVLQPFDLLPDGLTGVEARLRGSVAIELDKEAAGDAFVTANLQPVDVMTAAYLSATGQATDVQVTAMDNLMIELDYPSFAWLARTTSANAIVWTEDIEALPVVAREVDCRSGIHCTLHAFVDARAIEWTDYSAERLKLELPIEMESGDVTRIHVSPDAGGMLAGVRSPTLVAGAIEIVSSSGVRLVVEDDAWRADVDELWLAIDDLGGAGELVASVPIAITDLGIRDSGAILDSQLSVAAGAPGSWGDLALSLPGADGSISIRDNRFLGSFTVADINASLAADIEIRGDLAAGSGSLTVRNATLDCGKAQLSDFTSEWPHPWDITDGNWTADLQIDWRTDGDITEYSGATTHRLERLAGRYDDIAAVGLSAQVSARLDSMDGIELAPASLTVRLLDIGLPLEHIAADYQLDLGERSIRVDELTMSALGGEFVTEPFQFSALADANTVLVNARSIQLQLMVDLLEFEDIEATGAISGLLPFEISNGKVTIEDGRLESDSGGGVIRWDSGEEVLDGTMLDSSISLVRQTLRNLEFDSLTSDVNYDEAGNLKLQMRLSGINPDVDPMQPIILNLGVENNVPRMLRSLQAIRSIEDILQRHTAN
jgi:hypothetical protein